MRIYRSAIIRVESAPSPISRIISTRMSEESFEVKSKGMLKLFIFFRMNLPEWV